MSDLHALDKVRAEEMASRLRGVYSEVGKVIVGQRDMIEGLLLGLMTGGHILLEGVPGLAKTLAVSTLARTVHRRDSGASSSRPTCCRPMSPEPRSTIARRASSRRKKGPVFANIILADEINRAPAKVQSALLEAMQERQVTIGDETFPCRTRSWSWPRRTRSSRRAPTRCPRRRSTASS
jgi:MoxR-like ATPase